MSQYTMRPTINNAKKTAELFNARQVVVVAFDYAGRYAAVSYGKTKAECNAVKPVCDEIFYLLNCGLLPNPMDS